MSIAYVAQFARWLAPRLDGIHPGMLPLVVVLLVAMVATAVPLTAAAGLLVILRRLLVAVVTVGQPRPGGAS